MFCYISTDTGNHSPSKSPRPIQPGHPLVILWVNKTIAGAGDGYSQVLLGKNSQTN